MVETDQDEKITIDDIDRAPTRLEQHGHVDWEEKYHAISAKFTEVTTLNGNLLDENNRLRVQNKTAEDLNKLIGPYSDRAYKFMVLYCLFVAEVLIFQGFGFNFVLPDSVLQLLVGSTAVTVIGLVGMVLTGVFVGARSK